jgi:hypothetical protein
LTGVPASSRVAPSACAITASAKVGAASSKQAPEVLKGRSFAGAAFRALEHTHGVSALPVVTLRDSREGSKTPGSTFGSMFDGDVSPKSWPSDPIADPRAPSDDAEVTDANVTGCI